MCVARSTRLLQYVSFFEMRRGVESWRFRLPNNGAGHSCTLTITAWQLVLDSLADGHKVLSTIAETGLHPAVAMHCGRHTWL